MTQKADLTKASSKDLARLFETATNTVQHVNFGQGAKETVGVVLAELDRRDAELAALRAQLAQAQPLLDAATEFGAKQLDGFPDYTSVRVRLLAAAVRFTEAQAASAAKG